SSSSAVMQSIVSHLSRRALSGPGRKSATHDPFASLARRARGIDVLRDPRTNRGQAFTLRERQVLNIHGLLPPSVKTQESQLERIRYNLQRYEDPLNKYIYLMSLQDRNERLFYRYLSESVEEAMPLIYTPTVGLACQKFGHIFRRPRGLYITIFDKDNIDKILRNWPENDIRAIVVTDGERILGLGDLGTNGMGIPVGKLSLYTALAGVNPSNCLPIALDVGCNRKELVSDSMYSGLRMPRVRGAEYDEFIDAFMQAVVRTYGRSCLVQFEDFGNANAFRFLEKYRYDYCVFNDDIQGTASVAVAGLLAAVRLTKKRVSDNVFLFQGAGEANIGIAKLILEAMQEEGMQREEGLKKIFMVDSKGLITKTRSGLSGHKQEFAKDLPDTPSLLECVRLVKPTGIIGAAAVPGTFTPELLQEMGQLNDRPIVFALSNPTSQAECTAEEAYKHTGGRAIFASGSPFGPVKLDNGTVLYPGQGNNAYIFPGVALAIVACGIRPITDKVFLRAAQTLAGLVTDQHLAEGRLYPPLADIQAVSLEIAVKVAEHALRHGLAGIGQAPPDLPAYISDRVYRTDYPDIVPEPYDWPADHCKAV
ncbi:hypothetical protein BOX15_Mlig033209g1, partial [Macrostomum lignano]